MEIGEADAAIERELVDVRGADLAAETTNIGESEVIGDDDEEIGAFRGHDGEGGKEWTWRRGDGQREVRKEEEGEGAAGIHLVPSLSAIGNRLPALLTPYYYYTILYLPSVMQDKALW